MTYTPPTLIDSFSGQWRFLSNFWPVTVEYEGWTFESTEAAYQAAKTTDDDLRRVFAEPGLTAGQAKRLGRQVPLREDWTDALAREIMLDLTRLKFSPREWIQLGTLDLHRALVGATGTAVLIEGNTWHDNRWGVCRCGRFKECDGSGQNWLGKTIMKVRSELKENTPQ